MFPFKFNLRRYAKAQIGAILLTLNMPPMPPAPPDGEAEAGTKEIGGEAIGKVMGFSGSNIKRIQAAGPG